MCTSCLNKTYLNKGSCLDCPNSCSGCLSSSECTGCENSEHFLQHDLITCSHICGPSTYKKISPLKRCIPCPINCSQCTISESLGVECSKCNDGFDIKQSKCIKISLNNLELKIEKKNFKTSPPRIELTFNQIIHSELTKKNLKITTTKSKKKTSSFEPEKILHEQGSKNLKIYIIINNTVENEVLTMSLLEKNLIKATNNETTIFFKKTKIEIQNVRQYYPNDQITAIERSSSVISYGVVVLLLLSMANSLSSVFDFIKFDQMIGFIGLLNFDQPTNLRALLEFLRMNFLDFTPRFSSKYILGIFSSFMFNSSFFRTLQIIKMAI